MSMQAGPITDEINKIIQDNRITDVGFNYYATIHMPKSNLNYNVEKVLGIDYIRDYEHNITDEMAIELVVLPGTWSDYVMPEIENLEITVTRIVNTTAYGETNTTTRYRAYCKEPKNYRKSNPALQNMTTEEINRLDLVTVQFQLVPVMIEKLLPIQIGTNCVNSTIGNAMKALLMSESKQIQGLSEDDMLKGVDMVEPDNTTEYENLPIPHGVKLVNLPNYLQEKSFGVYQQGMGHYIQDKIWFVYPKWRTKRDDGQVRYINIFISYKDHYKYLPRTFRLEGEDIFLVGSLDAEGNTSTSAQTLNEGNGVRQVNPNPVNTDATVHVEGNKAIINRNQAVNEFIVQQSPTGTNNAPLDIQRQDINIYQRVSEVEGRLGKLFAVTWHSSSPKRVKPGTIVRIHYLDTDGKQQLLEGILVKAHHYTHLVGSGLTSSQYATVTGMFIFCRDFKN